VLLFWGIFAFTSITFTYCRLLLSSLALSVSVACTRAAAFRIKWLVRISLVQLACSSQWNAVTKLAFTSSSIDIDIYIYIDVNRAMLMMMIMMIIMW